MANLLFIPLIFATKFNQLIFLIKFNQFIIAKYLFLKFIFKIYYLFNQFIMNFLFQKFIIAYYLFNHHIFSINYLFDQFIIKQIISITITTILYSLVKFHLTSFSIHLYLFIVKLIINFILLIPSYICYLKQAKQVILESIVLFTQTLIKLAIFNYFIIILTFLLISNITQLFITEFNYLFYFIPNSIMAFQRKLKKSIFRWEV